MCLCSQRYIIGGKLPEEKKKINGERTTYLGMHMLYISQSVELSVLPDVFAVIHGDILLATNY